MVYFDLMMYHILSKLWWWWHCSFRDFFGDREVEDINSLLHYLHRPSCYWSSAYVTHTRPWWHMCCNGNSGGWRTRVCDWLEDNDTGYRKYQRKLDDRRYWDDVEIK